MPSRRSVSHLLSFSTLNSVKYCILYRSLLLTILSILFAWACLSSLVYAAPQCSKYGGSAPSGVPAGRYNGSSPSRHRDSPSHSGTGVAAVPPTNPTHGSEPKRVKPPRVGPASHSPSATSNTAHAVPTSKSSQSNKPTLYTGSSQAS